MQDMSHLGLRNLEITKFSGILECLGGRLGCVYTVNPFIDQYSLLSQWIHSSEPSKSKCNRVENVGSNLICLKFLEDLRLVNRVLTAKQKRINGSLIWQQGDMDKYIWPERGLRHLIHSPEFQHLIVEIHAIQVQDKDPG